MTELMRNAIIILLFCVITVRTQEVIPGLLQVHFSPDGKPTAAIINVIEKAKESIYVQAYSFTSAPIAQALKKAKSRDVDVQVILDKSQPYQRYTSAIFLKNAGIPVFIDKKHTIAHNKVIIIDVKTVVTGSFNFTKAAEEKNAENLLIIESTELARVYLKNWEQHKAHSE